MTPLRDDLVDALRIQPMTAVQAAAWVKTTPNVARKALSEMCEQGRLRRHGWHKDGHKTAMLFELVA